VELQRGKELLYTAKFSDDKSTVPGAKQIYRYPDRDMVALYSECNDDFTGEPLVRPVVIKGKRIEAPRGLQEIQEHARAAIRALPERFHSLEPAEEPYPVEISPRLLAMAEDLRQELQIERQVS
jgi:nicotinate phosphoribosyltransferase